MAFLTHPQSWRPDYWVLFKRVALIFLVPLFLLATLPIVITAFARLPLPGQAWLAIITVGLAAAVWFLLQAVEIYKQWTQQSEQARARIKEIDKYRKKTGMNMVYDELPPDFRLLKRRYYLTLSISLLLFMLFGATGFSYVWRLLSSPTTTIESADKSFLQDLNSEIEDMKRSVEKIKQQYSRGFIIMCFDGNRLNIYNTSRISLSNVKFSLSNAKIGKGDGNKLCISGELLVALKKGGTINKIPVDTCVEKGGAPIYVATLNDARIFIEPVAREGEKAVWIIGLKPA